MSTIESVILETADTSAAETFYKTLGVEAVVSVRDGAPGSGFRGFTLSLVVGQPADVDLLAARALDAGASTVKPPAKSMWGYGCSLHAPDGAVWTFASSAKKNRGEATGSFDEIVLLLGVDDVKASKAFYVERGLHVKRAFGGKYVEFDSGRVKLALQGRQALAKNAGVDAAGEGPHGIVVRSAEAFTDPDGFTWET